MEVGLVEGGVLFVGHLGLAALPDGDHGVNGFNLAHRFEFGRVVVASIFGLRQRLALFHLHADGVAHVVAVLLDEGLELVLVQEYVALFFVGVVLQVQGDAGAVVGAQCGGLFSGCGLNGVALDAVGLPGEGFGLAVCAGGYGNFFGDHERGVEAHAELADDVYIFALLLGVFGLELEAAGMSDGAQVGFQLFAGHADARVGNRDGASVLVERHVDGKIVLGNGDGGVGEALEVELVNRVGCVGDKLAQEDFLVGVNGVDHQIKELFAFRFELLHSNPSFNGLLCTFACWRGARLLGRSRLRCGECPLRLVLR